MKRLFTTLSAALTTASLVGAPALAQDRPQIVAVNYALASLTEQLAGQDADVVFPVPEGADPSFWRPAISDISLIQSADLVLLNGAGFAAWVDRVSLRRSKVVNTSTAFADRFIVTESITHSHGDGGEHSHEGTASYVWLDLSLAALQAEAVAKALAARGLASEDDVAARLSTLSGELDALDTEARAALKPLQGTPMIATHPRYQYFAQSFELDILSLEWDAGVAPSPEQLADLATIAADSGAKILIWEAEPPASALASTAELGLTNVVFNPMSQRGPSEGFITTYRAAVDALAAAGDAAK